MDLTQLTWQSNEAADSLAVVSNKNGQTVPAATWERQSNNSWYQYNTAGSWALNTSLYVMPQLCR